MASSHDIPLIDRVYTAASHLHHLNKPVPHFLMDVHDAMIPHIENLQTTLEHRGWAPVSLPPFLSTLQAQLVITGLAIACVIFLVAAALPRGGGGKNKEVEAEIEEVELKVGVVEEAVGEAGVEKQKIRSEVEIEVVETEEREEEQNMDLETLPVPASSKTVSIAVDVEKPAAPASTPALPPSSEPTTATPASPIPAPVSKKETKSSVDPRSTHPEQTVSSYRTSPIRTRSSTSSIPVRIPTTPARASSYPIALSSAVSKNNAATPARKTTSPTTSPASAKVLAASYAWVMSEGLEWDDGGSGSGSGSETEERSYNSGSHSENDENDGSSPRSRRSLEDELSAAGYAGGELDGEDDASEDDSGNDVDVEIKNDANANAVECNGALHPRRHSHTSDIEARYEEWRKTRASQHHSTNNQQKSMTTPSIGGGLGGGFVGGVRKTRSHHSRKDSVLENASSPSPGTGRSSLSTTTRSVGAATRHALLQRKRSSALKPWARKRKEDFGEWLKKKTNATATATADTGKES